MDKSRNPGNNCFECGRRLGKDRVERDVGGYKRPFHRNCVPVTARAVTSPSGQTYVDDEWYRGEDGGPVHMVYKRGADD